MRASIVLLPGDGIGPEVVEEARLTLQAVADRFGHHLSLAEHPVGGAALDAAGDPLPRATLDACLAADAVLLGAVGGPRWDDPAAALRPEQGLLGLRAALRLYANLRPVRLMAQLADLSPLRPERLAGVDILVVRELTGGIYFGRPRLREAAGNGERAVDTCAYTDGEIRRVVRLAFRFAARRRRLVTSIDKANVLESSRLWRQVATEVSAEHPGVRLEHQLVDAAAMRLITQPAAFDVIVTENLFGDILTDEASVLVGSIGLLPSASLGDRRLGLYEPVHGSAPELAGRGVANPVGAILSAALLLRHSLGLTAEALAVEDAVEATLAGGAATADMGGGTTGTHAMGEAVRERLAELQLMSDVAPHHEVAYRW